MSEQYLRKVSLIIAPDSGENAVDLSQLHFKFIVRRGDVQTPNSAQIRVYNVGPVLARQAKNKEFTQVILQAGYEGSFGTIFAGTILQIRLGRESATDTYMDILGGDGDRAYNFAVVNTTLAAGSTPGQVIGVLGNTMQPYGVTTGYMPELPNTPLPRGKVMFGNARNYMRDQAASLSSTWSIQDGALTLIPLTGVAPDQAVVLTSATGLIGLPEQTINGICATTLLNPNIKIGTQVQIDNASIQSFKWGLSLSEQLSNLLIKEVINLDADGFYRVLIAEHEGDTRGNQFYTHINCLSVNSSGFPPSLNNRIGVPDAAGQVIPY